jgi:hypothetical protein
MVVMLNQRGYVDARNYRHAFWKEESLCVNCENWRFARNLNMS